LMILGFSRQPLFRFWNKNEDEKSPENPVEPTD
jgi:hypothetical protein